MQICPLLKIIIFQSSWGEGAGDWNVEDREERAGKKKPYISFNTYQSRARKRKKLKGRTNL